MNATYFGLGLRKLVLFLVVLGLMEFGVLRDCRAEEPSTRSATIGQGPYAQYPRTFDGRGVLDALSDKSVTVSDSQYILAPSVSYNLPGLIGTSHHQFKPGQFVAYQLNDKEEVVSLWGLEDLTDLPPK